MQFIGQKVEVRFTLGDTGSTYSLYDGQYLYIVPDGSVGKRQTTFYIGYPKECLRCSLVTTAYFSTPSISSQ